LPGNSSGRGGSPGSRTGGGTSGRGLPGGAFGGGSAGWPGVAGGISGGSIGIRVVTLQWLERQRCPSGDVPGSAGREPGLFQVGFHYGITNSVLLRVLAVSA
jgi:hypothetical protein